MKTTTGIFSAILLAAVFGAPQAATAKSIAGLTGWWKMDGNLNDSSGNGNHAVAVDDGSHAIGFQAAAPGGGTGSNALAFPNNTEGGAGWGTRTGYIETAAGCCTAGDGGKTFSMGGWVKPIDEDPGTTAMIAHDWGQGAKLEIRNRGTGADFSPTIWLHKSESNATEIREGTRINPGSWHHVVVVYDGNVSGTNAITYINGAATVPHEIVANPAMNSILAVMPGTGKLQMGDAQGRPMQNGSGLDEMFFFSTALDASQVASIYNGGVDSIPEPSALVLLGTGAVSMLIRRRRSA